MVARIGPFEHLEICEEVKIGRNWNEKIEVRGPRTNAAGVSLTSRLGASGELGRGLKPTLLRGHDRRGVVLTNAFASSGVQA